LTNDAWNGDLSEFQFSIPEYHFVSFLEIFDARADPPAVDGLDANFVPRATTFAPPAG
jgi:hypothetical protein